MRKLLLLLCTLLTGANAMWAQNPLKLTFDRTGTNASSVTVKVEGVEGVSAVLTESSPAFRPTKDYTTAAILCPNANGNTAGGMTATLKFTITGLTGEYVFNTIGLDIHALNGSDKYQANDDNKVRQWNVKVDVQDDTFVTYSDIDIAAGVEREDGIKTHKVWEESGKDVNGSSPLTLTLTITNGTENAGCFFGLESITLSNVTIEDLINAAKAELQGVIDGTATITFGTTLGQYAENETYTSALAAAQNEIASEEATLETIATAKTTLETAIAGLTLNMPQMGTFLRITGASGKSIAGGAMTSGTFSMTDATDATTIFYYDGTHLINLGTGMSNALKNGTGGWSWAYGTENASEVTFGDGATNGGYTIKSHDVYMYDRGDESAARVDRGAVADADIKTDNVKYRSWSLAYVNELPIAISAVGYATLYSPVALAIPANSNLEVYTGTVNGNYLTLVELEGDIIPAQTAVILKGENNYNLEVTTGGKAVTDNALKGGLGMATEEGSILTLQQPTEADAIGFYSYTGAGLAGFKAYIIETEAGIKGLTFDFGTTDGIATVEDATKEDAAIYNLAGQRVEKAVKGVYIINGKKVLVK